MDIHAQALRLSASALASGALEPIPTEVVVIEDAGLPFTVRVMRSLARKPRAPGPANPFLAPDPALTLGDAPPAHRLLLNKFPVFEGHVLIVTRDFAEQDALELGDVEALCRVLDAEDAVGFYNGGTGAGASQRHRHLQVVWPPLGAGSGRFATEARLFAGALPFRVEARPMGDAALIHRWLTDVSLAEERPWNLLATRDAIAVIPRRAEHAAGISVNALGFAGSLLVRDEAELARVRETGPMAMLIEVGAPRGQEACPRI